MKKKITPAKQEVKKDLVKLLPFFETEPIESLLPIINDNIPMNLNSELEVIFKGKIKLNKLLDYYKEKIFGGNQNFVDLSFSAKKFLDVYQVDSSLDPIDYRSSYTTKGFETSEETLIPVKTIDVKPKYKLKILQVKDSKNNNFVLKRCWISLNIDSMTLEQFNNISMFLIDKYAEYAANKLYYTCRYSAKIAGYHIIQLRNAATNQMMMVTEMLSVFAGSSLSYVFPVKDSSTILDYFIQILHAGSFLEAYKIEHNDIRPNNFLIEFLGAFGLIKLIDFDVGAIQPQDLATNKGLGCKGFSDGYVAPEILLIVKSGLNPELQKQMLSELNPWTCHSYSMGILMLEMIGFIPNIMQLREFDPLKKTEKEHKQIMNKVKEHYKKETDKILKNIIQLIILCLKYNPEKRASVKEILTMIEHIDEKDNLSIQEEYKELCDKRKPSRTKLESRIKELENQINPLQMQNKYLNEERNSLIQSLKNRYPVADISVNDNLCAKSLEIINSLHESFETQINAKDNEINQLGLRIKELNEYQESSVKKDVQNQILNQIIKDKKDIIKVQKSNIKEKENENENEELNNKLNYLELKIKQYEENEENLTNEKIKYQKQALDKDKIVEQITQEYNRINGKFKSEKPNPNENIANINQNQIVIEKQKEEIRKLKDEIEKNEAYSQSIIQKFKNFISNLLQIIQEKGFEILVLNDSFDEIIEIMKRFLPEAKKENNVSNINNQCIICRKIQNYNQMKDCVISSQKLSKEVVESIIKNDMQWFLHDSNYRINEMEVLKPLVSISNQLEFIDLGNNPEFNEICLKMLIEAIISNQSLIGIVLYKNHIDIKMNHYITILEKTKTKTNLKCLYLDKTIIPENEGEKICNQYKMEINKWRKKNGTRNILFEIN